MLSRTLRIRGATRAFPSVLRATYSTSGHEVPANDPAPRPVPPNVSETNATPTSSEGALDKPLQEDVAIAEERRTMQAPNRKGVWSKSQQPREIGMRGPRFEQTIMEDQPRPLAAIELIHQQPVRWVKERMVSCDGGGGPLGHPRIFINVDKPQICQCTYCGLPFANEHHKEYLQSLPETSYPLEPTGNQFEVQETQRVTDEPLGQR
ncbi:hypothetical protein BDV95DRAFT_573394 [Massariosphaeria phaeospora]|uniref:Zinc finger CHCC-type domain-containing protein n=1 Tax=Massariosphaeria phaeospora TaxID=100035 RepID=A0A7C8I581_9PLEO|nr:hypothetical protein BDV95DRAFT_573394 [Massariosphaeria phaeospora]